MFSVLQGLKQGTGTIKSEFNRTRFIGSFRRKPSDALRGPQCHCMYTEEPSKMWCKDNFSSFTLQKMLSLILYIFFQCYFSQPEVFI